MQQLMLALSILALLGIGCSKPVTRNIPREPQNTFTEPAEQIPAKLQVPTTSTTVVPSVTRSRTKLQKLPSIAPPIPPIDDKTWAIKSTPFSNLTLTYPTQGPYAIVWNHKILTKNDAHLKGSCYVTANTIYQKTDFLGYAVDVCQTTTAFNADHGVRTDYFVIYSNDTIHLLTFTKKYPAGFDINRYGAILDHVLQIID